MDLQALQQNIVNVTFCNIELEVGGASGCLVSYYYILSELCSFSIRMKALQSSNTDV